MHTITKVKQLKLDTNSTQKIRPIVRSIPVQTPKLDIPATLDNAVDLNQITATAARPFLDLTTNICLIIFKDKNRMDPIMLNILCILTDIYDKSQANHIFHQALYTTLCGFFQEKDVMAEYTSFKL